ncbi:hypothetical protein [Edwardsiella tarda]|uniref:hypothetical protein n=1 Tax=Edwardsiella tarda TaxID=636 RepID=UPI00156236AC|nr:hypothetical protein [Edwardsiella tarda]
MNIKRVISYIIVIALTYNVILQPLLSGFGVELPLMRVDSDFLRLATGVFSLLGV